MEVFRACEEYRPTDIPGAVATVCEVWTMPPAGVWLAGGVLLWALLLAVALWQARRAA